MTEKKNGPTRVGPFSFEPMWTMIYVALSLRT